MSIDLHKSHNVTVLLYHLVFPAKYRRAVFDAAVGQALRDVCLGIEARYQLKFLEIGTDRDHVHFLVQSVPTDSVTTLVMSNRGRFPGNQALAAWRTRSGSGAIFGASGTPSRSPR
jgi:REP element-mobilizing transposase RayT